MSCQKCESERVISINGKCSDLCFASIGEYETDGHPPDIPNVSGGDMVGVDICLDCGQAQGTWPVDETQFEIDAAFAADAKEERRLAHEAQTTDFNEDDFFNEY